MAAAKKGTAKKPSAKKGKVVKEFKLVALDGSSNYFTLDPVPDCLRNLPKNAPHVVTGTGGRSSGTVQWRSLHAYGAVQAEADRRQALGESVMHTGSYSVLGLTMGTKGKVKVADGLMVGGPKPPSVFDDTAKRRQDIQAEAKAIEAVSLALLSYDNMSEAIDALNLTGNTEIWVDVADPDWKAKAEAKAAELGALNKHTEGLSVEARKRVFRHVCHAFNINKGATPFR